ncbi:GlxA family transcriptional regulator [Citreicoccus inhibens]|uniref:GlxA family transcriptional regulator n=1 Tax=Citreicoccus inhibens TaxID=2849499 RepID=UPI001EF1344D|nr:helix-turn-helix domain-containing protein [Citreicoccus inhibens]
MGGTLTQLVFDGVADGPVGVALDIVGAAARIARAGLVALPKGRQAPRHRLVSMDGKPVRTATKRVLEVDGALSPRTLDSDDVLVLPGLGMATPPAITAALERPDIVRGVESVARAAAKGVRVAASCSATFVLGAAGVLDGQQATTTWWLGSTFTQRFPRVTLRTDRMVVESGDVLTAGSAFAHSDLLLALLARRVSPSLAHMVARYLVLDERASQSHYMVLEHLRSADPVVRQLESFVTSNLARQVTVHDMARATATSPRTLARRVGSALGTTPQHFAQRLRIAQAVHLLETTRRSVDEVAAQVGYADPAAFRRVFRRETGETPRARRTRAALRASPTR